METFILKTVICSGILFGLYHWFLAKEKTFAFNRFYLIFSVIFSLTIPFLTIELPNLKEEKSNLVIGEEISQQVFTQQITEESSFDFRQIILTVYCLIAVLFLAKFIFSILKIKNLNGRRLIYRSKNIVLLQKDLAPFSFWNTIYISEKSFSNSGIDSRVFMHEEIHIQQKHSLDLIFIELTKAVLWINPFFYFYKSAMVNNHEFLADEEVINKNINIKNYQELILQEVLKQQNIPLTHQFNFNNTKKRFIMMTKQNSKFAKAKKFLAVPVFAIAAFVFAEKVYGNSTAENPVSISQNSKIQSDDALIAYQKILDKYSKYLDNQDYHGFIQNLSPSDKIQLHSLFQKLSDDNQYNVPVRFNDRQMKTKRWKITDADIKKYLDSENYSVIVDGKRIKNSDLSKYDINDFATFLEMRTNPKFNLKQSRTVMLMTENYYAAYLKRKDLNMIISGPNLYSKIKTDTIPPKKAKDAKAEIKKIKPEDIYADKNPPVEASNQEQQQEKTPAEFPDGMYNFRRSVGENFNQSPFESRGGIISTVIMISIDENGNTTDVKANGDDVTFNNEALRTVKLLTANKVWKPATENGKPVKSVFKIPLKMQFATNSPVK